MTHYLVTFGFWTCLPKILKKIIENFSTWSCAKLDQLIFVEMCWFCMHFHWFSNDSPLYLSCKSMQITTFQPKSTGPTLHSSKSRKFRWIFSKFLVNMCRIKSWVNNVAILVHFKKDKHELFKQTWGTSRTLHNLQICLLGLP